MQLKYKFVSTIITLYFYENNQSTALRGPNIWVYKKINPNAGSGGNGNNSTKIDGFKERIECYLPTLIEHRCSEVVVEGFFQSGTWMGHVIEHIALEIQTLAGMDTGFGRTRETKTWGPMLYSVIPKRTLDFSRQNQPLRSPNLNSGNWIWLRKRFTKMKSGNVFPVQEVGRSCFKKYSWSD
jgi:hypothetical protein